MQMWCSVECLCSMLDAPKRCLVFVFRRVGWLRNPIFTSRSRVRGWWPASVQCNGDTDFALALFEHNQEIKHVGWGMRCDHTTFWRRDCYCANVMGQYWNLLCARVDVTDAFGVGVHQGFRLWSTSGPTWLEV